jgi:hypothetical protein
VTYLLVMAVAAAAGVLTLWTQQRRKRAHLDTVEDFKHGLKCLSRHTRPQGPGYSRRPKTPHLTPAHLAPLDPKRRAAARRRLEARRRDSARIAS